jgi:cobaltochelatase CobT
MDDSADMEEMEAGDARGRGPAGAAPAPAHSEADPGYVVFDAEYDEEIEAEELAEPPSWNACAPISTSSSNR